MSNDDTVSALVTCLQISGQPNQVGEGTDPVDDRDQPADPDHFDQDGGNRVQHIRLGHADSFCGTSPRGGQTKLTTRWLVLRHVNPLAIWFGSNHLTDHACPIMLARPRLPDHACPTTSNPLLDLGCKCIG